MTEIRSLTEPLTRRRVEPPIEGSIRDRHRRHAEHVMKIGPGRERSQELHERAGPALEICPIPREQPRELDPVPARVGVVILGSVDEAVRGSRQLCFESLGSVWLGDERRSNPFVGEETRRGRFL